MAYNKTEYAKQWTKDNMTSINGRYRTEFVLTFKAAAEALGVPQSQVFKKAMQELIDEARGAAEQAAIDEARGAAENG